MDNIEELEKLKEKTNSLSENSPMGDFLKKTIKSIRNIVVYFVLGGLILYVCKLNKLVVIPTDIDKQPSKVTIIESQVPLEKAPIIDIKNVFNNTTTGRDFFINAFAYKINSSILSNTNFANDMMRKIIKPIK